MKPALIESEEPAASVSGVNRFGLFLWVFVGFILIDQAAKYWMRASFFEGQSLPLLPNLLELRLTYNRGIAFGLFDGAGVFFAPIALLIAGVAVISSRKHPAAPRAQHVALGLLGAGALGNVIDRLTQGKVTDMFWVRAINFPVFNMADICITIAAVLIAFRWISEGKSGEQRPQPSRSA